DCRKLEFRNKALQSNELYAKKYDINASEIDTDTPKKFFDFVTESDKSKNNLMLVHAYPMYRKMNLIQAEKWFLMKDLGRSGKGLFMTTVDSLSQVTDVNCDSLNSSRFEASNE